MKRVLEETSAEVEKKEKSTSIVLFADGGSRGNPGSCGSGSVLYDSVEKKTIWSKSQYLGKGTNNEAEYASLIIGLEEALRLGIDRLVIKMDSLLVVNQIKGQYRVKAPNLKPYFQKAKALMQKNWSIEHVRRENNQMADSLANQAMDFPVEGITSPLQFFTSRK